MKGQNIFIFTLLLLNCCIGLNAQNSVSVFVYPNTTVRLDYETFNINDFRSRFAKSGSLDYVYTQGNGTQVRVTCQRLGEPIQVYETPPEPALYRIFKEFYPDGKLKEKGVYLPYQFRVGEWIQCGSYGDCHIVDNEINRGSFGYNKLLELLEKEGYVNQRTGWNNWVSAFWYTASSQQWGVKLTKDNMVKILTVSARTGEIVKVEEFNLPQVSTNQIKHSDYYVPVE